MIETITAKYSVAFIDLFRDLWLWFLLGFLMAALIQEFISTKRLLRYFGDNDYRSLARATISGLFISICSCGAIPIAAMLRNRGASTATTLTFLLATPWAGLIHFFIISGFVGLHNAFLLVTLSLTVAFLSGIIFAFLENRKWLEQKICLEHREGEEERCAKCFEMEEKRRKEEPLSYRMLYCVPRNMWYIFKDVGKYILIGLLIAVALKAFVPATIVTEFLGNRQRFIPILIAVPISAVIELCSEGFTILTGQLYLMGASLGVIFTMIMVGVSTDFTELTMIYGKFGKRSTIAYLTVSTLLVICFAFLINLML